MQLTTRDVLWATLVIAIGLGWWNDHLQMQRDRDLEWKLNSLVELIQDQDYVVTMDGKLVVLEDRRDDKAITWRSREKRISDRRPASVRDSK
jgi:hypothetical protein